MQKGWRSHSQFNKRQISRVIHLDGSFIDPDICADFDKQLSYGEFKEIKKFLYRMVFFSCLTNTI